MMIFLKECNQAYEYFNPYRPKLNKIVSQPFTPVSPFGSQLLYFQGGDWNGGTNPAD